MHGWFSAAAPQETPETKQVGVNQRLFPPMKKKCSATVIMQVAATWLIHLRVVGRSRRTISTYETAIKNLDRFLARRHRCDPRNVRPSDVEEWRRLLVRTGCQPATVNQFLRTAGYLFRWLVAEGRVAAECRLP